MLTVNHVIRPSPIHGLGVFTCENVRKGQLLWRFDWRIDRELTLADLHGLPAHTVDRVLQHAEFIEARQVFVLASDGDYYMNHADEPSLIDDGTLMFAARDLSAGAELTCDYRIVRVLGFHPDHPPIESPRTVLPSGTRELNSIVQLSPLQHVKGAA